MVITRLLTPAQRKSLVISDEYGDEDDYFWKAVEHMAETGRDYYKEEK